MESMTGWIVSWDRAKGYGYVQSGERREFLHLRDFAERHKVPEVGDVIVYTLGADNQGRSCATRATHQHDGGRVRTIHIACVALLLVAPAWAAWRLGGPKGLGVVGGAYAVASVLTYFVYASDKQRARRTEWRIQESTLHLFEMIGGWPGAFLAQRRLRHKCTKVSFQLAFWFIIALHQYVAIDCLAEWRMSETAIRQMRHWSQQLKR